MSAMVAVERAITAGRAAGKHWAGEPLAKRVKFVRALREALALEAESIAGYVSGGSRPLAEVLSAEVLPLLEACRFLEREAATLLKTRRLGISGRPVWLGRVDAEIRREPHGVVAVVAPSNYPLFLPGVQALQAIAAGNAVVWKPAAGGGCVASAFLQIARKAGLPEFVLQVLPESVEAGRELVAGRVDKVIFTGGSSAGVQVLHALADRAVPAVVELSGCDAVFVRQDADVRLVARAMRFGLQLNRSRTCIAPRRVFVARGLVEALEKALISEMACADKWNVSRAQSAHEERMSAWMEDARVRGGRFMWGGPQADGGRISLPCIVANASPEMELMQHDVFEAVLSLVAVDSDAHALELASRCPFALGATIFTRDEKAATHLATEVKAGWVCINDVIAPSADPRIPFGGTGRSGFGVTRGAEGLLEMTRLKVVQIRKGGPAVHLAPEEPTAPLLAGLIRMLHGGGWRARASGLFALIQNAAGGADAKAPKGAQISKSQLQAYEQSS